MTGNITRKNAWIKIHTTIYHRLTNNLFLNKEKTCFIIYYWRFIEFLRHGFRLHYDTNGKINRNMCCQWLSCEYCFDSFYFIIKPNKMKKIDYFGVEGVQFWEFAEEQTEETIKNELDSFRKSSRPSYMFINALLTIQQLQELIKFRDSKIYRLEKKIKSDNKKFIVFLLVTIIWIIASFIWFWTIISFFISLIK